jgi:hypothetical protein
MAVKSNELPIWQYMYKHDNSWYVFSKVSLCDSKWPWPWKKFETTCTSQSPRVFAYSLKFVTQKFS